MAGQRPVVFPQPQQAEFGEKQIALSERGQPAIAHLVEGDGEHPIVAAALQKATNALAMAGADIAAPDEGSAAVQMAVQPGSTDFAAANADQAYSLLAGSDGVGILASGPVGLLYGAITFARLVTRDADQIVVPECTIRDWPDLRFRGVFCESRWGQDLMTLGDWQEAIDYFADCKFNMLTIGIYNCWPIQYYGQPSEFFFVPVRKYPQLATRQRIDYHSPNKGAMAHLDYLADMFVNDTFGEIAAYGQTRGVTVRPHFNSPGHNSHIPRMIPEISALDSDGNPTGYGFCLSNERTYEVMFDIIDEIADRHLLPNGVRSYHIAGDEVYPLIGMHPDRPFERVSPWCECPECSKKTSGELYVEYILRIAKHLRDKGVTQISMWYDQLVRSEQMGTGLREKLREAGLEDNIVLHWWRYHSFFDDIKPELGLRRWVTPMTGYYYQMAYRGHIDNIYLAGKQGHEQGAEGTESYGVFDRAFHRHFCALSEWGWNFEGGGTPTDFARKYAAALFGENADIGEQGLRHFRAVVDSAAGSGLAAACFRYSFDYAQSKEAANARDNYPQYTLRQLVASPPGLSTGPLGGVAAEMRRAREVFAREEIWLDPGLRDVYLIECDRIIVMAEAWLQAAQTLRAYANLREAPEEEAIEGLTKLTGALESSLGDFDAVMSAIEEKREHYVAPHMLREMTFMRQFLARLAEELAVLRDDLLSGPSRQLPELDCMRVREVPWVEE